MSYNTVLPAVFSLCSKDGLTVYPERSSSATGRGALLLTAWTIAGTGALVAAYSPVWPVALFMIAAPAALTVAFRANMNAARAYEKIRFYNGNFDLQRFDAKGHPIGSFSLPAYHMRFVKKDDEDEFSFAAVHQGRHYRVAEFLSIPERRELFAIVEEGRKFFALSDQAKDEIRARSSAQALSGGGIIPSDHPTIP